MKLVSCIVGTRPELIKMAPVIRALQTSRAITVRIIFTAQHRGLLDQMASFFGIVPDVDFNLMQTGQSPGDIVRRASEMLERDFVEHKPALVLAQGDTATVFAAAISAFHRHIPFAHVEAGLRSCDLASPFPEEGHRAMVSVVTELHFAPTAMARENLLREGISAAKIYVTGNPVIDALYETVARVREKPTLRPAGARVSSAPQAKVGRQLLVTLHRRENLGLPMRSIAAAVREALDLHPDLRVVFPVHPNPEVRAAVECLAGHPRVQLCDPMGYEAFVRVLAESDLVLTDSGGVQEEAPALGIPVLVARTTTERPEGVESGCATLVGTQTSSVLRGIVNALETPAPRYPSTIYGDGQSATRIAIIIERFIGAHGARWAA